MSERLSMRKYAEHRGVTVEAVSKAVKAGRISCERNDKGHALIDPAVADKEWEANTDQSKFRASGPNPNLNKEPEGEDKKPNQFQLSTTILKSYQARMAKLEFDERAGQLHDVEDCKKNRFKVARLVRDSLLGLSDRLSAELAGETDQFEVRKLLDNEVRKILESISLEIESLHDKVE